MLSRADIQRVHSAIAEAESATTGEIFCVVAKESSKYREASLAWAAGAAILAPLAAQFFLVRPAFVSALLLAVQGGWAVGQAGALDSMVRSALVGYGGLQVILFAAVLAIASLPAVRPLLVPASLKRQHVHARAMEQFAHRLHATKASTGILIYASLAERRVEIVADEAIHRRIAPGEWDRAVKAAVGPIGAGDVAGGLVAAIEICGAVLAEHFPHHGAPRRHDGEHLAEV